MLIVRNSLFSAVTVTAAILFYTSVAFSQNEGAETVVDVADETIDETTTDEPIEEVVVYAHKPGDKIDLDARYEELFRTRIAEELDRLDVLDEEYEWRKFMSESDDSSRIKWGYNPEAEMSMRRDTSLTDLPTDIIKPATLFRVQF